MNEPASLELLTWQVMDLAADLAELREQLRAARAEITDLRRLNESLVNRIVGQSEVLSRMAERKEGMP